jgi:hypothetical protein
VLYFTSCSVLRLPYRGGETHPPKIYYFSSGTQKIEIEAKRSDNHGDDHSAPEIVWILLSKKRINIVVVEEEEEEEEEKISYFDKL